MNSLRAEIRATVDASDKRLSIPELYAARTLPTTYASFVVQVCQMVEAKQLRRYKAPKGSGSGVRSVYGPGPTPVLDHDVERTPRKMKGFMEMKREREARARGRKTV